MNWYLTVVRDNYANFKGRARRKEYWMYVLFNLLFSIAAIIIDTIIGTNLIITAIYILIVFVPGLAVLVRRLHDIGKSGAWFFISFVPIIGGIWLLVLLVTEGNPGDNVYGTSPKAI